MTLTDEVRQQHTLSLAECHSSPLTGSSTDSQYEMTLQDTQYYQSATSVPNTQAYSLSLAAAVKYGDTSLTAPSTRHCSSIHMSSQKIEEMLLPDTRLHMYDQLCHVLVREYADEIAPSALIAGLQSLRSTAATVSSTQSTAVSAHTAATPTATHINESAVEDSTCHTDNASNTALKSFLSRALTECVSLELRHARSVDGCRLRDSERGLAVIPDYDCVNSAYATTTVTPHPPTVTTATTHSAATASSGQGGATKDKVVLKAYSRAEDVQELVRQIRATYPLLRSTE